MWSLSFILHWFLAHNRGLPFDATPQETSTKSWWMLLVVSSEMEDYTWIWSPMLHIPLLYWNGKLTRLASISLFSFREDKRVTFGQQTDFCLLRCWNSVILINDVQFRYSLRYSVDFGKNEVEVLKHAANYMEHADSQALLDLLSNTQLKVIYQTYDWGLNN